MPSGGITITPGKILGASEEVSNAKLNQGFRPVGQVNPGAITDTELSASLQLTIDGVRSQNLLCNGDFRLWLGEELGVPLSFSGAYPGSREHDNGGPAHWMFPNDTNRATSRVAFTPGQTDVPDALPYYLHWVQSVPVDGSIATPYVGQRLEDVTRFSGRQVSMSIWVRATTAITLTPQVRQFFGTTGSADVVTDGDPVTLTPNVWTEITQTFDVPDVTGKTITEIYNFGSEIWPSFTEFRLQVPDDATFTLDLAHAMLAAGSSILGWDNRLPFEDYLFASRYYQIIGIMLSADVTAWVPSVNLRVPMRASVSNAQVVYVAATGTGAEFGFAGVFQYQIIQTVDHSVISQAYLLINGELNAPA